MQKQYNQTLKDAGFRVTAYRIKLLEILDQSELPLSIEQIARLYPRSNAPDMATLYRAVADLTQVGLIKEVNLQHGHAHYEYGQNTDHHHLVCTQCGKVEDIKNCNLQPKINASLKSSKYFTKATDHSFEIYGTCKACQKNSA